MADKPQQMSGKDYEQESEKKFNQLDFFSRRLNNRSQPKEVYEMNKIGVAFNNLLGPENRENVAYLR